MCSAPFRPRCCAWPAHQYRKYGGGTLSPDGSINGLYAMGEIPARASRWRVRQTNGDQPMPYMVAVNGARIHWLLWNLLSTYSHIDRDRGDWPSIGRRGRRRWLYLQPCRSYYTVSQISDQLVLDRCDKEWEPSAEPRVPLYLITQHTLARPRAKI